MGIDMERITYQLHWDAMLVHDCALPSDFVGAQKHVRMVMNNSMQYAFLNHFFPQFSLPIQEKPKVWISGGDKNIVAGTPQFCKHVGSMIRRRGLLANLSMRENLLLPFLYIEDKACLKKAEAEVDEVAEFLGLASGLNEQAGERSAYTHALISLGHCLLKKPDVIVAQEVHIGMPPERLQIFRDKAMQAMAKLDAGVLYLTSASDEGSGLDFARTYEIECASVPDMSGIW